MTEYRIDTVFEEAEESEVALPHALTSLRGFVIEADNEDQAQTLAAEIVLELTQSKAVYMEDLKDGNSVRLEGNE